MFRKNLEIPKSVNIFNAPKIRKNFGNIPKKSICSSAWWPNSVIFSYDTKKKFKNSTNTPKNSPKNLKIKPELLIFFQKTKTGLLFVE
jgi:hypothetical protein